MNVDQPARQVVNSAVWERPDMRHALAARDVAEIYRLLQRIGVSQRKIAALTGQSQSEISEILSGSRQVMAYDVLVRIADGLGIPRGYMGLAYDEASAELAGGTTASAGGSANEREEVRQLLAHAAEVTMGASVANVDGWWQPVERAHTPLPQQISNTEIDQIEAITHLLRLADAQYGGGACRSAAVAQAEWVQQLLCVECASRVVRRLHLATADLLSLAGWTSFDVGLYSAARRYFKRALEHAQYIEEPSMVAKILYCMGRLHLHRNWPRDALKFFQLGQIAAQESGSELTVAMLCGNEAWAYAVLGDEQQALKSLGRAEDEFTRAEPGHVPTWVRFFGAADLNATVGVVNVSFPEPKARCCTTATTSLQRSLAARTDETARSRAFELTALATAHLLNGDLDHGADVGHDAVDLAERLHSVRIIDRLTPLAKVAARHPDRTDVRELAERIATLRSG